ncbi:MAG TPA: STAS domain-containing protein [Burkholderiales bacterium]|nr:STAS domain-containing protein [Burkholderiales bacterium]
MAITIEASAGRCRALVRGNMTIYEAAADKRALLDALAKADDVEIDLSAVSEMDTAGLQLLILAERESLKAGKRLSIVGHSESSLDVLDRYNLASYFGDPLVITRPERRKTRRRSRR